MQWNHTPGTAGAICLLTDVKTVYNSDANSVGADLVNTRGLGNSQVDADVENAPWLDPSTGTQAATFMTPVAQVTQYDGSIPSGRQVIRARRVLRTPAPTSSPVSNVTSDNEYVDVIARLPEGFD
jgi:hypothetical protein